MARTSASYRLRWRWMVRAGGPTRPISAAKRGSVLRCRTAALDVIHPLNRHRESLRDYAMVQGHSHLAKPGGWKYEYLRASGQSVNFVSSQERCLLERRKELLIGPGVRDRFHV